MKAPHFFEKTLNRLMIKNKMIVFLVPFILLSYLCMLFSVYFVFFKYTQDIVTYQADVSVQQKMQLLDAALEKIQTEMEVFMFSDDIQEKLRIDRGTLSEEEAADLESDISRNMHSIIINYNISIQSICVVNQYDDFYLWKMDSSVSSDYYEQRLQKLRETADSRQGEPVYSYEALDRGVVTVSREILDLFYDRPLATIMVDFDLDSIATILAPETPESADPCFALMQGSSTVIYNSSALTSGELAHLPDTDGSVILGSDSYLIRHLESEYCDWNIISLVNERHLYWFVWLGFFFQSGLILVSIVIVLALIYCVSNSISSQFSSFMYQISQTNTVKPALVKVDSQDEFQKLAKVYNDMSQRIEHLIDTVYSKELLRKEAEIQAFQAQINPHFLYNTLDCINGLVELKQPEAIKKTVTSLASIMRMSIKGKEILTLRENLQFVEQYMYIERTRYQNKILFLCEIPESMMDYLVPKLILQPLLENAVIHGVSEVLGQGMIGLFGEEEENAILLHVKDNGKGFSEEVIQQLEQPQGDAICRPQNHIGLRNIQARIQLMYGTGYGVRIRNLPKGGSCVTVRLPKILKEESIGENSHC